MVRNPGPVLTRNYTGDLSVLRPALNPLSLTSQGPHRLDDCRFRVNSGSISSLTLLFSFNIELTTMNLLPVNINFRISLSIFTK